MLPPHSRHLPDGTGPCSSWFELRSTASHGGTSRVSGACQALSAPSLRRSHREGGGHDLFAGAPVSAEHLHDVNTIIMVMRLQGVHVRSLAVVRATENTDLGAFAGEPPREVIWTRIAMQVPSIDASD
jgi:hypothetical protein